MTVPEPLRIQRDAWEHRRLLRWLYTGWYRQMIDELSAIKGPTVEVGCGIGTFKEIYPPAVATDVLATPWVDQLVDAQRLPYEESSVANLVMTDVLHHLPRPLRFISEAERVLRPGGRVVMLEPFCSPLSAPLYRAFHFEVTDLSADPFSEAPQSDENAFSSNQALPTLMFWRDADRFRALHPQLEIVRRKRFGWLIYPLSGGFTGRRLAPYALRGTLAAVERALGGVAEPLAAFRCLVVLEKR